MRFFCDEMLKRVGRWLRAAGYDTLIQDGGGSDRLMLQTARRDQRLLISRDRKLRELRHAAKHVILLRSNALNDCIEELSERLNINWLYRPFTRCLVCNMRLVAAGGAAWVQVPDESRAHIDTLLFCSGCSKLYWQGTHVRHMRSQLAVWQHYHISKEPVADK